MATPIENVQYFSNWVATALTASGYHADFTLESLKEIDRFFEEHSRDGAAVPGGLLSEDSWARLFALGAYVGEVIIRSTGGKWRADENTSAKDLEVVFPDGSICWPGERVLKRFKNGSEDGIYAYGIGLRITLRSTKN